MSNIWLKLNQEIENVQRFYNQLKALSSELKAKKQQVLEIKPSPNFFFSTSPLVELFWSGVWTNLNFILVITVEPWYGNSRSQSGEQRTSPSSTATAPPPSRLCPNQCFGGQPYGPTCYTWSQRLPGGDSWTGTSCAAGSQPQHCFECRYHTTE